MSVLVLNKLSVGYRQAILQNINTELVEQEFVILLGANGVGKSTLLKTILNHLPAINGEVILLGKEVRLYSNLEMAKKVAIVTTQKQFDYTLHVKDVLELGRIPYLNFFAKLTNTDKDIIEKYIEKFTLSALLHQKFSKLSDGQKQKVLIARALIQNTPVIILDEPTVHLDVKNRMQTFELLKNVALEENKTIICATHEIDIALRYATKVWLIDKHQNFIIDDANKFNSDTVYCNLF